MPAVDEPLLRPTDRAAWRRWLEQHHASHRGLFLILAKKHLLGREPTALTYEQALEEALCFGWIDGLVRRFDDDWRAIRFTPRRDDSIWSESNKRRVARLRRAGLMTPAGERLVRAAKKSGRWNALRGVESLEEPAELRQALARSPAAARFWHELAPSHRKQWLYWVTEGKRPETRERRIAAVVRECADGRKPGMKTPTTRPS